MRGLHGTGNVIRDVDQAQVVNIVSGSSFLDAPGSYVPGIDEKGPSSVGDERHLGMAVFDGFYEGARVMIPPRSLLVILKIDPGLGIHFDTWSVEFMG